MHLSAPYTRLHLRPRRHAATGEPRWTDALDSRGGAEPTSALGTDAGGRVDRGMASRLMATSARFAQRVPAALPNGGHIPRTLIASVALMVVVAVGVLQVLQTSNAATAGYELRALERERADVGAQVRLLEAQIAQTAGEGQLRELAIARLGMVPAKDAVHVAVDTPAPAVAALPERYVVRPQPTEPSRLALWEQALRWLPGFH